MMDLLFNQLSVQVKTKYELADKPYDIPVLPEAQCIVIPVVREAISPLLIRNNDADMVTDTVAADALRVRIIASKTKGVEKRRGNQILRTLGVGGRAATNKAFIKGDAGDVFDLNTFVFGDSANGSKKAIYPVHAAVLYSDALSVQPLDQVMDDVFRQGGIGDEGVSYDAERHRTSSNIFITRAVMAGAVFVQSLVMTGRRMTREAFDHLLLAMGLAGSYGGATATTGTNLKTTLAGVYWGSFERPLNSPHEMLKKLETTDSVSAVLDKLTQEFSNQYPQKIAAKDINDYAASLVQRFEAEDKELRDRYQKAAGQMKELFNAWFIQDKSSGEGKAKGKAAAGG